MASSQREIFFKTVRELPGTQDSDRLNSIVNIFKGVEEYILDDSGTIVSSNLEAVTITGYEEWEVIGRHFSIFYSVEDQIKRTFEDDLEKATRQGFLYSSGVKMKKRNSPFWAKIKIEAILNEEKIAAGYRLTIQDSTHRALYSHNISLVKDEYLNLFNNPFIGIFKFRMSDFKLLLVNERAELLFGKEWSKLYLNSFFIDSSKFKSLIASLTSQKKVENYEFEILNSSGVKLWASISCKHFETFGFVEGVIMDVTDMKREVEKTLSLSSELESFIYHASHDLRSPITSILGLVNLMKKECSDDSKVMEYSKLIEERVNHLDYILRDIVEIAFNTAVPLEPDKINFALEVESIIRAQSKAYPSVQCSVEVSQPKDVNFCNDLTRIRSILRNVISNAFKYNNPMLKKRWVKVNIDVEETKVLITIQDNGIGINAEYHEKIFSLFYKATESHKGNGLGLSIVKSMVSKLGGEITLDSAKDKGSSFHITIPNTCTSAL